MLFYYGKCLYYADISPINVFITTELLKCHIKHYCDVENLHFNSYIGDTLLFDIQEHFNIDSFDAVIGNPPYNTDQSKEKFQGNKPIYNKFIDKYIVLGKILLFVIPSRWFAGGKGLEKFRASMLKRKDIKLIHHQENAKKWFGKDVDITGGVHYLLKDENHNGNCLFNGIEYDLSKYDCIILPRYHQFIDIISNKMKEKKLESIQSIYTGRSFGIETNDVRLKKTGNIPCFVSALKSKDRILYLDNFDVKENDKFWKVITPTANGKALSGFGYKIICNPEQIHSCSYFSFRINNEEEAKYLLSYLDTKFANHLLSTRKISQQVNKRCCLYIPLVPLDRMWDDKAVCDYFDIQKDMYM